MPRKRILYRVWYRGGCNGFLFINKCLICQFKRFNDIKGLIWIKAPAILDCRALYPSLDYDSRTPKMMMMVGSDVVFRISAVKVKSNCAAAGDNDPLEVAGESVTYTASLTVFCTVTLRKSLAILIYLIFTG